MSSIRISELPLVTQIGDDDVLVINEDNLTTAGIQLRHFIGDLTSKDLNFTGSITIEDANLTGDIVFDGQVTHNNSVIFNDPVIFNDVITIPNVNGISLDDLDDVNVGNSPPQGSALIYDAPNNQWVAGDTGSLNEVVDDPSPQLGGDLDVNGNKIVSRNNNNILFEPNGSGMVHFRGGGGVSLNGFRIYDENNNNFISLVVPEAVDLLSSTQLKLPADAGTDGYVLKTDGIGQLTWAPAGGTGGGGEPTIDLTDLSVITGGAKDGGELTYNNLNGVFTYNPADLSNYVEKDELDGIVLDDLGDVDTTTSAPTDGQALVYSGADTQWIPQTIDTANNISELDDVNLTNLTLNQILVYDGAEWVNQNNEIPGAIKFRGSCDLTKSIADPANDDVDNDPNDRIYGYFWVNSSGSAGAIDASWVGLSGDCQGLEYVVWTVGNDFAILGRTGDIAPVIEVHEGTGISIDYNQSPGNKSQPTINLADTAVTPGVYAAATVTVDQQGRLTDVVAGYNGSDGALDGILADYLPLAGGTLTGDLLLEDKITLNATIGSAQFEGNIFTGDSENGNVGAIIAPTNAGITFNNDDG